MSSSTSPLHPIWTSYVTTNKRYECNKVTLTRKDDFMAYRTMNQAILQALVDYSGDSSVIVEQIKEVWGDGEEGNYKALDNLCGDIRTFLTLIKAGGGQIPNTSATNSGSSSPKVGTIRKGTDFCAVRDEYRCIVTGARARKAPADFQQATDVTAGRLVGAHIVPFSITKREDSFHIPFDTIMKYFDPKNEIKVDNLDVAQNIVTLDGSVHASFGAFGFVILRTNESDGSITYRIEFLETKPCNFYRAESSRLCISGDQLYLDGNHPQRPDPQFCRLHEIVGRVLHASGFGRVLDMVLEDDQDVDPQAAYVRNKMRESMENEGWTRAYVGVEA